MECEMYIDGEWCGAKDGSTRTVINPATEEPIAIVSFGGKEEARRAVRAANAAFAIVSFGGKEEARRAVRAANAAFSPWSKRTVYDRAEYLISIAEGIRDHLDDLARLLTLEVGKPLAESEGEVKGTADQFEWYGEEVKRVGGDVIPAKDATKRYLTLRHPLGVVAAIAPWNFPLLLLSRKVAPALAAGCTVVGRPSTRAPMAVARLFSLIHEVGLPRGVANLVFGEAEAQSDVFSEMEEVSKISFTGSVDVGKRLMMKAAKHLKKVSLELGGHAPYVIFADVDPEVAADKATYSKFRNMGQVCISPSRFYVQESILEEFAERAVERVKGFHLGNGLDDGVTHGPLQSQEQVMRTEELVSDMKSKGGVILAGGKRPQGFNKGFFYEPTIATRVSSEMKIMRVEPFAPILPIIPFSTEEEALSLANDTPFGLAAYVLTQDLSRAVRMCEGLEAGIIALNDISPATACCPFGGMKQSGIGREGWHEGLEGYYETKYISLLLE